jgi:opacity protein-like surface antigen
MDDPMTNGTAMAKRFIAIAVLAILAVGTSRAEYARHLSIGLHPGTLLSIHGAYSESETLRDTVIPGVGLGLVLRYRLGPHLSLDAGYGYNWMFLKAEKRPSGYADQKPALVLPMYTLGGTVFLASGGSVEPYLSLGIGLCPWRFSSQAFGGSYLAVPDNSDERFSKTSLDLNGGLGIEIKLWSRLSLSAEADYHMLFAKDAAKFGTNGFGRQGFLGIRAGLVFHFGGGGSAETEEDVEQ